MEKFVVGDVIVVTFPFSDLTQQKLRPALVVARVEFGNVVLAQITSKPYASRLAIPVSETNFALGNLPIKSYVRPDKLFTADPKIIRRTIGKLKVATQKTILSRIQHLFTTVE